MEKKRICIDPGHGGRDQGASYKALDGRQVREKDYTLAIAKTMQIVMRRRYPDAAPFLTRNDDSYVLLRKRSEIANRANTDLFVSVHLNASENRRANGSQVYVYGENRRDMG